AARLLAVRVLTTAFLARTVQDSSKIGRATKDSSKTEPVSVPDRHPLFQLAARWAGPGAEVACTSLGPDAAQHGEANARHCRWSSRLAVSESNQVEGTFLEASGSAVTWTHLTLDAKDADRVVDSLRVALRSQG